MTESWKIKLFVLLYVGGNNSRMVTHREWVDDIVGWCRVIAYDSYATVQNMEPNVTK